LTSFLCPLPPPAASQPLAGQLGEYPHLSLEKQLFSPSLAGSLSMLSLTLLILYDPPTPPPRGLVIILHFEFFLYSPLSLFLLPSAIPASSLSLSPHYKLPFFHPICPTISLFHSQSPFDRNFAFRIVLLGLSFSTCRACGYCMFLSAVCLLKSWSIRSLY
jgi:hypothetical protein